MTLRKVEFILQRTKPSGEWIDVDVFQSQMVGEAVFKQWAEMRSRFFLIRLIERQSTETELLLDHVPGGREDWNDD